MNRSPRCRFCAAPLTTMLVDLGSMPLANSFVTPDEAAHERRFPLQVRVCSACFLVQASDSLSPDAIFSDYAYFSSYSDTWVAHARRFAESAIARFGLTSRSLVVEVASNDGYLLQHFARHGVPVLGIEPAENVAQAARAQGIATEVALFGTETAGRIAAQRGSADLIVANNVLAHVPAIRDFVAGFAVLLKPEGVATFEVPHVLNLLQEVQFDTIYHEHFSYLSLLAIERVFAAAGMKAIDVEEIPTHGGSLRVFAVRQDSARSPSRSLDALRAKEHDARLDRLEGYAEFAARVDAIKVGFLDFLAQAKSDRRKIAAYGAAAKGNTFLNYCGVSKEDIVCVFDRSAAKQNKLLPGSHIPVLAPERLADIKPDYLVILPWNIADEIRAQNRALSTWGGKIRDRDPTAEDPSVKFHATDIAGTFVVDIEPNTDERGSFARLYCKDEFAAARIDFEPVQVNVSRNIHRHTLRGLHYRDFPDAEAKLVHVSHGAVYDVVVDLRRQSPTFARWAAFELGADTYRALFIPEGCAHGFLTLEPQTDVLYHMGRMHVAGQARGYRWNDPVLNIRWPAQPEVISVVDQRWPDFSPMSHLAPRP